MWDRLYFKIWFISFYKKLSPWSITVTVTHCISLEAESPYLTFGTVQKGPDSGKILKACERRQQKYSSVTKKKKLRPGSELHYENIYT